MQTMVNIMNLQCYFSLQFLIISESKCSQDKSSFSREKMCLKNILKLENIERKTSHNFLKRKKKKAFPFPKAAEKVLDLHQSVGKEQQVRLFSLPMAKRLT